MKCKYCGKNIEDGAPFCAYCGNMQNPQVPVQNEGTPNKNKGANIALGIVVVILALAVCAGAVTAAVAYRKTKNFRGYVASYEEKQNEFWSLAGHDDEYAEYLDEANSLADKYKFWAYEEQREKMEALCDEISDLNDSIAEYREAYDKTIEEMESDGKYYCGDYADDYEEAKEECLDAMKDFDERKSKKNTEALEELAEEIKDYNVSEGEKMQDEANSATSAYDFLSCERYLINDAKNKITEAYEAGNYADERAQYENFCEQVSHFTESASRVISAYSQVDVSDNNLVRVYFNYDDDENWNTDDFVVYELKEGTDFWQACQLSNIEQIKGHMTMDIVADISDSMEYQFDDMKNSVVSFTNSTTSDTYLGLSTIGSVYTREQEFTQDKNIIRNSVNSLECYGLTSLYQSLYS